VIDTLFACDMYQVYETNDDWLIYAIHMHFSTNFNKHSFSIALFASSHNISNDCDYAQLNIGLQLKIDNEYEQNCIILRYRSY